MIGVAFITLMCISWRLKMKSLDNTIEKGYYLHSKKLGEGGFGQVKLGTHILTNQKVAIKIISKKKIGKDLFRVQTEIAALKQLRHKNIAKLLQVVENDECIYLVMEYCSAGELFDYLVARSRLTDVEAKRIVKSLISALAYMHAKGFAHRDIKPENILLDENHNIKLIDFGLAAHSEGTTTGSLNALSTCCGSPAYVAPELIMGLKYNGPAADVWSTGVLLYTLVCGKLPFTDRNLANLYKKIKTGSFEIPSFVQKDTRNIIKKMLVVDPAERITISEIMQHPWYSLQACNIETVQTRIEEMILKEDQSKIEDSILLKCAALFPHIFDLVELKRRIVEGYGYETATYWLVKKNPSQYPDLAPMVRKQAVARRRSRSFSDFNDPNKLPRYELKVAARIPDAKPVTVRQTTKETEIATPAQKVAFTDVKMATRLATVRKGSIPVSKKLFNGFNDQPGDNFKRIGSTRKPTKVVGSVSPPNKENLGRRETYPNSPLKAISLDEQKEIGTPKKSLFRRFLESATPKKNPSTPRAYSEKDKNFSTCNIMITDFTNVDECLEAHVKYLTTRRINCQVKNYTIRCVASSRNVILVAFDLEFLICRESHHVVIRRKRIRGSSWEYVKLLDELKKIQPLYVDDSD